MIPQSFFLTKKCRCYSWMKYFSVVCKSNPSNKCFHRNWGLIWAGTNVEVLAHACARPRPCPLQHRVTGHVTQSRSPPLRIISSRDVRELRVQRWERRLLQRARVRTRPGQRGHLLLRLQEVRHTESVRAGNARHRERPTGAFNVQKISDRARCACANERMNPVEKQRDDKHDEVWDDFAWMECVRVCYSWVCVSAPVGGQRSGPLWWLLCCFTLQCACISRLFVELIGFCI